MLIVPCYAPSSGNSPSGLVFVSGSYSYKAANASTSATPSIAVHISLALERTEALHVLMLVGTAVPPSASRITYQSVSCRMLPACALILLLCINVRRLFCYCLILSICILSLSKLIVFVWSKLMSLIIVWLLLGTKKCNFALPWL